MNILLLRQYNPYIESGASANRFRGLIDGICREGHCVTIGITGGFLKKNESSICSNQPNLNVVYLSKANHYNGIWGRLNTYFFDRFHLVLVKTCLKRLMRHNYDLVWLTNNDIVLSLYLKGFKGFSGKSFIELNEFNDIYKGEGATGNFLQKRKGKRKNQLFLKTVNQIDLFAVMTETLIEHYSKMSKSEAKFMLLPMTVDLSRFDNITSVDNIYHRPYIAFAGTMNNHKDGVDVLIKSFAKIAGQYPKYHLYLAGFWHNDVLMQEKLIEEFGLKERIHYLGMLNREQIPPFVCNASVLALSRPNSHQAQGGFPTKLGEYLATRNPVCVTKVGEIPNYLKDNVSAYMAEPGDVDSFADALDRALQDPDNARQVGTNGRIVAEESFSAEVQSKRLAIFLENNIQCQSNNN